MSLEPLALWRHADRAVWGARLESLPLWRRAPLRLARLVWALARDFSSGQLTLRAMSLVYTTLLSLVPLLAVSFSVLKAFGVHNQIEPMLRNLLAALGDEGMVVAARIVEFISNINVGVLGAAGLAFLIYTVMSLMQKIEEAFNFIWHVPTTRRFAERFSRYLSVLLIGPILVFAALGITASFLNNQVVSQILASQYLGWFVYTASKIAPYFLVAAAFTFLYLFIPNTRVRFVPALIAGIAGGVLWQSAGWAFAAFVATSSNYEAIYSGFAVLLLFMIWMYVSWLILLFGASVGFYMQHPEYLVGAPGESRLSNRMRERLALTIMSVVGARHCQGERPATLQELTSLLGVPMQPLQTVLDALERGGLLAQVCGEAPAYLPARDLHALTVRDVLSTVRSAGEEQHLTPAALPLPAAVEQVIERLEQSLDAAVADTNVAALANEPPAAMMARNRPRSAEQSLLPASERAAA